MIMTSSSEIIPGGRSKFWPQWLAAATIHILALLCGMVGGWASPYLAKLTAGTESLTITSAEASWIASLLHLSRPIGSIVAAGIVHKLGARNGMLIAGVPHVVGWTCFLIKESVPWVYASRVSGGFAMGMYLISFPHYIGEIGNEKIRGALIALVAQGQAIGYLLGNLMGAYLSMKNFAIINLILNAIFLVSFFFFPNTAYYLVKRSKIEEAKKSLKWYNRQNDVTTELEAVKEYMGKPQKLTFKESFKRLSTPLNRKTLGMVICVYLFMQLSGIYTIAPYLEILLTTLKINVIAPSLVVICVSIVAVIGGLLAIYTNDHFGRRSMLAVSTMGVSITFVLIGVNYLLLRNGYDISNFQWFIITEFMMFIFFLNIGLTNIPSCLLSELFSPELKEIGSCIANVVCSLSAFIATKRFQPLLDSTSEEFIFFLHAFLVFLMFVYTIIVIPETKGKTLQEIQTMLMKKKKPRPIVQTHRSIEND
ncbi:facilitated trehalose transporter Tret1 [Diachasma alloeum]|uniref:facilitated trehalose transporter Tret1 n=1 Tax=Diachasma alloeum TaxID=454923 RepID=UPI000738155B|nr:facilitated trehalose transporter Tret1 [Diachasma alloeum]